jgi:hypothetical protein
MQVPLLLYSCQYRTTTAALTETVKLAVVCSSLRQQAWVHLVPRLSARRAMPGSMPHLKVQIVINACRLLQPAPAPKVVSTFLKATNPAGHAWKYMAMGPDGWLYIAVGSPCDK